MKDYDKNDNQIFSYDENGYYVCDEKKAIIIPMNFVNKLHQSRISTKKYYSILKNELLSYNLYSEFQDNYESFKLLNSIVAHLAIYRGIIKIRLEFNKKKTIKKFKDDIKKLDEVLVSNGYIEMYVDNDEKLNLAINLIGVLMRDLETEKNQTYNNYDFVSDYETILDGTFIDKEDEIRIPELVVKSSINILNNLKMFLIILVGLIFLTGITTCYIYKANTKEKYPTFDILDNEGNIFLDSWTFSKNIDVFNDPNLDGKKIIYPGRKETYYFYIANTNDFSFKCNINFTDDNEENINMKYRFRIANANFGNEVWKNIKEINVNNLTVEANSKILCALDWAWLESDRDTEIGKKGSASYTLNIHFSDFIKVK